MKTTMWVTFLLVFAASAERTWARGIYVDANAAPGGDGTIATPYQTIAQAMERAREIRQNDASRIVVRVAPGVYNENFPIYVNVSNLALSGSTVLMEDDDGLPGNCGSDIAAVPCIQAGTETLITPLVRLPPLLYLFIVGPTKDNPATSLTDVTISGFVFDGQGDNVTAGSGTSIHVDRVANFFIHHNVIRHGAPGLFAQMASGRIQSNFAYNNVDGFVASGGSEIYPARVELMANRSINNNMVGAIALGSACARCISADSNIQQVQSVFDPAQNPAEVPDKLFILVIGNDFGRNAMFGFRFDSYISGNGFYDTTDNQPMTANITATVRGNLCRNNAEYGFLLEGVWAPRTNPRKFTATFNFSFENNDCSGTGRAGVFAGFMANGQVTRNPAQINTFKYLQDSRFTLQLDDATLSSGLDYDNPILDPADKQTPLNNQLTINGDTFTGKRVTCPPGFPCAP